MKIIWAILLLSAAPNSIAQINAFTVDPYQTDANYDLIQDPHFVVRDSTISIDRLLLFLGGTSSEPDNYEALSSFAGSLGYDVISLSYVDTVPTYGLTNSPDSLVFNKYRQEICYGTPESDDVTVDSLNSIYTRTIKLLSYLHLTYPTQNWDQYLATPTSLNWSKIAVAGHSQGSGHACYFGKLNAVERVLMFSGPNDYSNFFGKPANWLRTAGITGLNRQFAYLSLLDEVVDFDKQLTNLQGLMLFPTYDTTYVDDATAPFSNSHCLYTTQPPGFALIHHNSPIRNSTLNEAVWAYLLESSIFSGLETIEETSALSTYPNPTNSFVTITYSRKFEGNTYQIYDLNGQLLKSANTATSSSIEIDLSDLPNGTYMIGIENQFVRIVKLDK